MKIEKDKIKKILCIKLRGIGDVILSSVIFDNLKKEFPNAKIDYLTEKPSKIALEKLPFLNEVIIFDRNSSALESAKFIFNLRRKKYDLVFDFFSNPRTAVLTYLTGAKYRAGYPYRGRKFAYNLFGPEERDKFHAAQLHLEFLKKLDLSHDFTRMYFGLGEDDSKFADEYFNEKFDKNDFVIGLSPSGGWQSKKCDPLKFAEIGDALVETYGAKLLLLWGPGDKVEALEISKKMKHQVILAPLTDIRKMGALISKCKMIVANDSGPMHISTALEIPTLSLHGPTSPFLQGPFGEKHEWVRLDELDCIQCNLLDCPKNHECFVNLPLQRVLLKIDSLIKKNNIRLPVNEKS